MPVACITGIGRGIGKALAERFVAEGYEVIGTIATGRAMETDGRFMTYTLDLSSPESIAEAADAIRASGKSIDILINNAGALFDEDDTKLIPEKLRRTLEVNLIGTADFTERLMPAVAVDGHVLFISSTAGSLERTGHRASHFPGHYPAYKISKAALNMYMRTLAMRTRTSGPTVSSVHPGWVRTDMGGEEADISSAEAASDIYAFAVTRPETGGFWYRGERLPW